MERVRLITSAVYLGLVLGVGLFAWQAYKGMKPGWDRATESQAAYYDALKAEQERQTAMAAEKPEISQEMYNRQVAQARESAERVAELEAQLAPEPEAEAVEEPEPEFVDCSAYQRIPTDAVAGAKVAQCGGLWFSGSSPGLMPLDGWNDQPKKNEPGVIHTNLRYRWVAPSARAEPSARTFMHPTLGKVVVGPNPQPDPRRPRTYRGAYGSVEVHSQP